MLRKLQKRAEGFTIIEVLIVLAIAGLIMLIVFLAVPALQRNSRNTRRRNDVAVYLAAVNEWSNNNNGKMPTTAADVTAINDLANTGYLNEPTPGVPPQGVQNGAITIDNMQLVTVAKCDTVTVGNTAAGGAKQFAVRFALENSTGGAVPQCQDS